MTVTERRDSRVHATMAATFGFTSFRPLQEDIITSILDGRDVFALMPTGGGKSLCYQLPALLLDGLTVVVSPLIALMKDQVDALSALGIPATFINSSLAADSISRRQAQIAQGKMKLVYVAPERLMTPAFLRLLGTTHVALFAIDEAHCISEWGHDFRPEYRELRRLRVDFPGVPLAAFTATATARVQADIVSELRLGQARRFRASFNRPNLYYQVRPKRNAYAQLVEYLRSWPKASGIIYCQSRAGTETLARQLNQDGLKAVAYHAGLESDARRERQEAFIKDDVPIVVATIAFGMGIDKPDVRFVIHYDLPKTLENYYQESGRAGRDGEPSDCILFYTPGDVMKVLRFTDEKETEEERQVARWQLHQMSDWAEATTCRRQKLLEYFDEQFEGQDPPCCDVCRLPTTVEDVTIAAQKFLSCVKRTGERFGAGHVIQVLRGSRSERVLRFGHDKLSTYGIGRDRSDAEWRAISEELVRAGYVRQNEEYRVLTVTRRGEDVLFRGEKVVMTVRQVPIPEAAAEGDQPNAGLFDRLRALRKKLADAQSVPPYVIFHDRALRGMAAKLPRNERELTGIQSVGEYKARTYGPEFLATIAEYVRETGAAPTEVPPEPRPTRGGLSETVLQSLELYRQGMSITQIAKQRGLHSGTIEGHLGHCIAAGEDVDLDTLISPQKQQAIRAAMEKLGADYLGPVKDLLGDEFSYGELRLMRARLERETNRA